jgi:Caspase domain
MAWEARFVAGGVGHLVAVPVHEFDPAAPRPGPNFAAGRMHGALPSDLIVGDSEQNGSVSRSRMAKPAGEDDHRCGRLHVGPTRRRRSRDVGHAAFLREVVRAPAGIGVQRARRRGHALVIRASRGPVVDDVWQEGGRNQTRIIDSIGEVLPNPLAAIANERLASCLGGQPEHVANALNWIWSSGDKGSRHTLARPIATGTGLHILAAMTLGERRDAMGHPIEWLTRFVAAVVVGTACLSAPAFADKRIALVIGNSAYQNVARLDNPKNDAGLMAETLRGLGFTLIGNGAQIDLDKAAFDDVLQKFGNQLVGADVAFSITPVTASRCTAPTTSCR